MATVRESRGAGLVLGAATLAMGLIAGAFYIFACGVMPGLARGSDRAYIEAMQNINAAFENAVFFASFFGALLLTAVAGWLLRHTPVRWWVLAALLAYFATVVLTVTVNVPLNDELADAGDPARIADPGAVRADFEDAWVAWNVVRAVLSTLALGFLARALVLFGREHRDGAGTAQSPYLDPTAGSSASR
ncbi:membrane protein [Streptomyces aureoverticillatus]|nr:membrane protein [Streptomyces aureoverticillatus]